jgi:hypothetical protein
MSVPLAVILTDKELESRLSTGKALSISFLVFPNSKT